MPAGFVALALGLSAMLATQPASARPAPASSIAATDTPRAVPSLAPTLVATPPTVTPPAPEGPTLRPDDPTKPAKPAMPELAPLKPVPPPGLTGSAPPTLGDLFDHLREAPNEDDARIVDLMIQAQMMQSGSPTVDLLMDRALTAVQGEDIPLAFDLLDSIIALKPDYAEGWNKRATLYFLKHDYGKAISDLEMVLRLQPRHYHALIGLANMLNEMGDKKHALEALKRVLLLYPTNSEIAKEAAELEASVSGQSL